MRALTSLQTVHLLTDCTLCIPRGTPLVGNVSFPFGNSCLVRASAVKLRRNPCPWVTSPAGGGEGHVEAGWDPGAGKEDVSILVPSYHIHARHPPAPRAPPPWVPSPGSSLSLSTSCSVSPSRPALQAGVWTRCLHRDPPRLSQLPVLSQPFPIPYCLLPCVPELQARLCGHQPHCCHFLDTWPSACPGVVPNGLRLIPRKFGDTVGTMCVC